MTGQQGGKKCTAGLFFIGLCWIVTGVLFLLMPSQSTPQIELFVIKQQPNRAVQINKTQCSLNDETKV